MEEGRLPDTFPLNIRLIYKLVRALFLKAYGVRGYEVATVDLIQKYRVPDADAPEEKFWDMTYRIFSDYVLSEHARYLKLIYDKFKINIEPYLHGYKIMDSTKSDNRVGTVFYVYRPEYFNDNFILVGHNYRFRQRNILKIQDSKSDDFFNSALEYEAYIQHIFEKKNIGPKIIHEHHLKLGNGLRFGLIIMEKFSEGTVQQYMHDELDTNELDRLISQVISLVKILGESKLTHGDLHWDNVGLVYNAETDKYDCKVLDFGCSVYGSSNPRLEILQLLRTINTPKMHQKNVTYIENKLYQYYMSVYKDNLVKSLNGKFGYHDMYMKYLTIYYHKVFAPNKRKFLRGIRYNKPTSWKANKYVSRG